MQQTSYTRATTVEDALAATRGGTDAKYLSGGQTLLPTMKQRLAAPSDLIDLRHVSAMKGIEVSADTVRVGGAVTHYEVSSHSGLASAIPALAELAGMIGDMAVRHMGTIGGSVANNDPAADYPGACLALDAVIETDRREVPAREFFTGMFETALADDEIVTAVRFRVPDRAAYEKFRNPASRYAMAGAFVAVVDGSPRVAVTGAGSDGVFRWSEAEHALGAGLNASALENVALPEDGMLADMHASAGYRAHLVKVMAMRAAERASGPTPEFAAMDHTQGQIGGRSDAEKTMATGASGASANDAGPASSTTAAGMSIDPPASGNVATVRDGELSGSERDRHIRDSESAHGGGNPGTPGGPAGGNPAGGTASASFGETISGSVSAATSAASNAAHQAGQTAEEVSAAAGQAAASASASAQGAMKEAGEAISNAADRAGDAARSGAETASRAASDAGRVASDAGRAASQEATSLLARIKRFFGG